MPRRGWFIAVGLQARLLGSGIVALRSGEGRVEFAREVINPRTLPTPNDLTQLTLGVDRDSQILAHLFDEQDPGVKKLIEMVTQAAHALHRKVGLCGQAPSDHPEFATFLADIGLDSISVTPDALARVVGKLV